MRPDIVRTDFTYQYPPFNLLNTRDLTGLDIREPLHVYVHIPFCKSKCKYCYYKVWSVGEHAEDRIQAYLDMVFREIEIYARRPEVQRGRVYSLYVGGGTPTLLTLSQLDALAKALLGSFDFAENFEFSIEGNPDERVLTPQKLECLKRIGVTRLSLGVESLSDRILAFNGRGGRADQFRRVYRQIREIGFKVVNLDFMSGMLGENWGNWKAELDEILALAPENVSVYKMEFYLNSRLTNDIRRKAILREGLLSDAEEAEMAQYAFDRLQDEGGYIPSNCFSLAHGPEVAEVHYKRIWDGENLLGIGLSAHGVLGDYMYQNTAGLDEYFAQIGQGRRPVHRAHRISARERIARTMVDGVRTLCLERQKFIDRHGFDMSLLYSNQINELVEKGLVEFDGVALRVPRKCVIYADDICRHFFLSEHETMMRGHLPRERIARQIRRKEALPIETLTI